MIKKIGLILIIMMLFAGCAMADENNAKDKDRYKVTPIKISDDDQSSGDIVMRLFSGTITQGDTDWYSKYVGSYITTLDTHLVWGDPSDSLSLTIYSPDEITLGPYYDSFDGSLNGRIDLRIEDSHGVEIGTWDYRVYGYSVSGTETYTIGT
ncbi:MAG: hypothetical protein PWQ63_1234 [Methanolobus sp.]|jgi:hypothetical protein|nr:hypothetical protein [Methanolobus sp.]MDK2948074.1 hypothetical protein [Methanolobus sp.]